MTADFLSEQERGNQTELWLSSPPPHLPTPPFTMVGSGEGTLRCRCGMWSEAGGVWHGGNFFSFS